MILIFESCFGPVYCVTCMSPVAGQEPEPWLLTSRYTVHSPSWPSVCPSVPTVIKGAIQSGTSPPILHHFYSTKTYKRCENFATLNFTSAAMGKETPWLYPRKLALEFHKFRLSDVCGYLAATWVSRDTVHLSVDWRQAHGNSILAAINQNAWEAFGRGEWIGKNFYGIHYYSVHEY